MEMTISIRVVRTASNGGEYFVYTDNSLMGVYASAELAAERLADDIEGRMTAMADEDEEQDDSDLDAYSGDAFGRG